MWRTYCRPGLAAAARRLHRRGQAVRLWLLGCSHRCDRPGGGCCSHWRGQARRLMQPRGLNWKYIALFDIIHLISSRLAMPGVDTLIFCGLHQRGQTRRLLLGGCISAARPGGCCSAAASARPDQAAVARRLHQRGQTRRLLLGSCISAARPGGIRQHAGHDLGALKSN